MNKKVNIGAALLASAISPALAYGLITSSLKIIPITFIIALAHAIILGLPAYFLLSQKKPLSWLISSISGFIIGSIVAAVMLFPYKPGQNYNASVGGKATVIDGIPTLNGWFEYAMVTGYFGLFGMLGGLTFWLTLTNLNKISNSGDKQQRNLALKFAIPLVIFAVSVSIFMIPSLLRDRSCHNPLRDGASSISPEISIDLKISNEDWPILIELFSEFSLIENLDFKNISEEKPEVYKILYMSMCDERGFVITINEQRWSHNNYKNMLEGRGVGISTYEMGENTNLEIVTQKLVSKLEAKWPGRVKFRDSLGYEIQKKETQQEKDRYKKLAIADAHYHGLAGNQQDYKKAYNLYEKYGYDGSPYVYHNLGLMRKHGLGTKIDYKAALNSFKTAAKLGYTESYANIGLMYDEGIGVPEDNRAAAEWYKKGAATDDAAAQNSLGWMYKFGEGVEQDYVLAAKWYCNAAKSGAPQAMSNCASMYKDGLGVEQDYKKAFDLEKRAASSGYPTAKNNLARMYENGWGIDQDYIRAIELYEEAANDGLLIAKTNLGAIHEKGIGTPINYKKALMWFTIASLTSNNDYRKEKVRTAAKLSKDEVEIVKRKIDIWVAKYVPLDKTIPYRTWPPTPQDN